MALLIVLATGCAEDAEDPPALTLDLSSPTRDSSAQAAPPTSNAPTEIAATVLSAENQEALAEGNQTFAATKTSGAKTRYPIILMHGLGGSDRILGLNAVANEMRAHGYVAYNPAVPPFNGPKEAARLLAPFVDEVLKSTGAAKVNLIAHSLGGLAARSLVSEYGYADRVASVSTVSSPHRGSLAADYGLRAIDNSLFRDAADALARWLGRQVTTDALANDASLVATLTALSEEKAGERNRATPDKPGVYYQSWAAVSARLGIGDSEDVNACDGMLEGKTDQMDKLLIAVSLIVGHGTGLQSSFKPNDGLVSVESAKWGHFNGCVRADHFEQMSRADGTNIRNASGFYAPEFYEQIAADLAPKGF